MPPYITEPLAEPGRYQTVFAADPGSAAAPTAGLHFTPELLARLDVEHVTLHVGLDTFRPLAVEELELHELHGERYRVTPAAWARIGEAERVLAVGTTTVRVLETVARGGALEGRTTLYVLPGFEFRRVDALLTNFHLPRSTLLALVMAFAGVDAVRDLYRLAIDEGYRFYSFGDAMLILVSRAKPGRCSTSLAGVTCFTVDATDGAARAGTIATLHGDIPTPAFMPVGTKATVKTLHPDEVRAMGAAVILGNTYHLHFRPGEDVIEELGGLHALLGLGRADPDGFGRFPGLFTPRHAPRCR